MAITNPLKDFVITGIKSLMFYDSNGDMIADIDKLTDINISDETATSELRGGLGNPVLLKIYGDRTCQLSATNSTLSMDLLKILTGNTPSVKTVNVPKVQKKLTITSDTVTLATAPASGTNVSVYLSNANGENITKLTKITGTPTAGQFAINSTTITFATGTTGVANVYYFVSQESEVLQSDSGAHPIFKAYGKCLLQSISNNKLYAGHIEFPNCQVNSTVNIAGKNSSDSPDANSLTIDLLSTTTYPYAIIANEIASATEL